MISVQCECGLTYQVSNKQIGRRFQCRKCQTTVVVPGDRSKGDSTAEASDAPQTSTRKRRGREHSAQPKTDSDPTINTVYVGGKRTRRKSKKGRSKSGQPDQTGRRESAAKYGSSLLGSILFPINPENLMTFFWVWLMMCSTIVLAYGGFFGVIGIWIISGLYCQFLFSVIAQSAAGKRELPELSPEEGIWLPLLNWICSWCLVLFPAFVYLVIAVVALGHDELIETIPRGLSDLLRIGMTEPYVLGLLIAGIFVWPMVALCIALAGFGFVVRVDLILMTIIKTFPSYLFTALVVTGATCLKAFLDSLDAGFGVQVLTITVAIYLDIVAMQMIGFYYHHFKDRFAWSWG